MRREYGDAGGAYFVRRVAVAGHAVAADEYYVNLTALHEGGGHVVAQEGGVHAGGDHLEGREARALEEGARLVAVDAQAGKAALDSGVDGGEGGTVLGGGEGAGVAVGEDAHAWAEQGKAVSADGAAYLDVLVHDGLGLGAQSGADIGGRQGLDAPIGRAHPVECPKEVHRRGPGGSEVVAGGEEASLKLGVGGIMGREVGPESRRHADGGRPAYAQRAYGLPDILDGCEREISHLVRQQRLVNDDEGVPRVGEFDSIDLQRVHFSTTQWIKVWGRRRLGVGKDYHTTIFCVWACNFRADR